MAKRRTTSYSHYAREATELLGHLVHNARIRQKMTVTDSGRARGYLARTSSPD